MSIDPIQDLFLVDSLSSAVERFATSVEGAVAAPLFDSQAEKTLPLGDSVRWDEVAMSRGIARTSGPDSPTESREKAGLTPRSMAMYSIKEHVDLPSRYLNFLRAPGMETASAQSHISRELRNMANRIGNTRELLAIKTLQGAVDFSLVPNSDFNHTITFPVATHTVGASWALAGTNIRSEEIPEMRRAFRRETGRRAGMVIVPSEVEGYFVQNTEIKDFAKEALPGVILAGSDISSNAWNNLGGLRWDFTDQHYALDSAPGTTVNYLSADTALVLPASGLGDVLGMASGSVYVPSGPIVIENPGSAASAMSERRGFWSYAELTLNPLGIRIHAGWRGAFYIKETSGTMAFSVV